MIENFNQEIKLDEDQSFVEVFNSENERLLMDKMENWFKIYEKEFKETINKYQEVFEDSSNFYEREIEMLLKSHITENFNAGLCGVNVINIMFEECKEKTFSSFRKTSKEFHKRYFENIFLKKLNDYMMKNNLNYTYILSYFCNNESLRITEFPNQIYISEIELKRFHENEKAKIIDSVNTLSESKNFLF